MSCSHQKRENLVSGEFIRPKKERHFVESDTATVWLCRTCGAIRIDMNNEFVYRRGVWSQPHRGNLS